MSVLALALVTLASSLGPPRFVIAIGNNAAPSGNAELGVLRYADDDAVAVAELFASTGAEVRLLSTLDATTQARAPHWVAQSTPPTLHELRRAVDAVAAAIARSERHDAEVVLFFSGHGSRTSDGAALALHDAGLTQAVLYDEILARLPARRIHLLIDACHADAVVRTRDGTRAVAVDEALVSAWMARNTLARFPHVGALVASSADAVAHEWDAYGAGVFTHQLTSALRGGADVNGDGRVTYSETQAFIAAANRGVHSERARLSVLSRPPEQELDAALTQLATFQDVAWLVGDAGSVGHFYVEDVHGARLLELHGEAGHHVRVAVPARVTGASRSTEYAALSLRAGEELSLASLVWGPRTSRARDLAADFRQGLYAEPFGPRFFQGFVSASQSVVTFEPLAEPPSRLPSYVAWGVAGVAAVSAATSGVVALDARHDYLATSLEREAAGHKDRYDQARTTLWVSAAVGVLASAVGVWLW